MLPLSQKSLFDGRQRWRYQRKKKRELGRKHPGKPLNKRIEKRWCVCVYCHILFVGTWLTQKYIHYIIVTYFHSVFKILVSFCSLCDLFLLRLAFWLYFGYFLLLLSFHQISIKSCTCMKVETFFWSQLSTFCSFSGKNFIIISIRIYFFFVLLFVHNLYPTWHVLK